MKERRDLFVTFTHGNGKMVRMAHFNANGLEYMCDCETMKSSDITRTEFYKLISWAKRHGIKTELSFGLKKFEYINVNTGKREKLWGT